MVIGNSWLKYNLPAQILLNVQLKFVNAGKAAETDENCGPSRVESGMNCLKEEGFLF